MSNEYTHFVNTTMPPVPTKPLAEQIADLQGQLLSAQQQYDLNSHKLIQLKSSLASSQASEEELRQEIRGLEEDLDQEGDAVASLKKEQTEHLELIHNLQDLVSTALKNQESLKFQLETLEAEHKELKSQKTRLDASYGRLVTHRDELESALLKETKGTENLTLLCEGKVLTIENQTSEIRDLKTRLEEAKKRNKRWFEKDKTKTDLHREHLKALEKHHKNKLQDKDKQIEDWKKKLNEKTAECSGLQIQKIQQEFAHKEHKAQIKNELETSKTQFMRELETSKSHFQRELVANKTQCERELEEYKAQFQHQIEETHAYAQSLEGQLHQAKRDYADLEQQGISTLANLFITLFPKKVREQGWEREDLESLFSFEDLQLELTTLATDPDIAQHTPARPQAAPLLYPYSALNAHHSPIEQLEVENISDEDLPPEVDGGLEEGNNDDDQPSPPSIQSPRNLSPERMPSPVSSPEVEPKRKRTFTKRKTGGVPQTSKRRRRGPNKPRKKLSLPPKEIVVITHDVSPTRLPDCPSAAPDSKIDWAAALTHAFTKQGISKRKLNDMEPVWKAMIPYNFPPLPEIKQEHRMWDSFTVRYMAYKHLGRIDLLNHRVLQILDHTTKEQFEAIADYIVAPQRQGPEGSRKSKKSFIEIAKLWRQSQKLKLPTWGNLFVIGGAGRYGAKHATHDTYQPETDWQTEHLNFFAWFKNSLHFNYSKIVLSAMHGVVNPESEEYELIIRDYLNLVLNTKKEKELLLTADDDQDRVIDMSIKTQSQWVTNATADLKFQKFIVPKKVRGQLFQPKEWNNASVMEFMTRHGVRFLNKPKRGRKKTKP
ncbi:hypothetical protein [Parendozoicomonas haliclonae]|uniref:hypothetical protein n=1 Tax=Parendozoicomonas haliclonae TaxID=1960125 RepID=UPI001055B443|nr:hypothetical protein [Parendozoicomonas haliclonae]